MGGGVQIAPFYALQDNDNFDQNVGTLRSPTINQINKSQNQKSLNQ
jgi:hypothetical protein